MEVARLLREWHMKAEENCPSEAYWVLRDQKHTDLKASTTCGLSWSQQTTRQHVRDTRRPPQHRYFTAVAQPRRLVELA